MRRFIALVAGLAVFALLSPSLAAGRTSLVLVSATHAPTTRHHAHKAGKHHRPKHRHNP